MHGTGLRSVLHGAQPAAGMALYAAMYAMYAMYVLWALQA